MPRNPDETIVVACLEALDADENPVTHYFSDKGMVTGETSSPPHFWVPPRLREAGGFSRRAFARGVSGRAESSYGRLVLENADGGLNALTAHAFDGRPVTVWTGKRGARFPDDFTNVLAAQVKAVKLSRGQALEFTLGAALAALEIPPSEVRYLGDNVLPEGVEGLETDLKDKLKPMIFGAVRNAEPVLVNTVQNDYQVPHNRAQIEEVYSAGNPLERHTSHTSLSKLMTNLEAGASEYDVYEGADGTYFRLGFNPTSPLTFDATGADPVTGMPVSALRDVFQAVALQAGVPPIESTYLDELSTAPVGLYVGMQETKLGELFNKLAASGGAAWWVDGLGKIRLFKLREPATPIWRVTDTEALNASATLEGPTGGGIPAKGIDVSYAPIEKTQDDTDLAAVVSQERRNELKEETRHVIDEDAAVAARHLAAQLLPVETRLRHEVDAAALATSLQALHGKLRVRAVIEVALSAGVPASLEVGDTIAVTLPRLSLNAKPMLVVGLDARPAKNRLKLDLWA